MIEQQQPTEEWERLRAENEQLHQANLELLLRQSEMIHENHKVWQFVTVAKRFHDRLLGQGFHDESVEWVQFLVGLEGLKSSLKERLQDLEPTKPAP